MERNLKLLLLLFSIIITPVIFAQNYKSEGNAMAKAGNYSGAAAKYKLCIKQDEDCLFNYLKLITTDRQKIRV